MGEVADFIVGALENIARFGLEHYGRFYSSYRGYVRENRDPEDRHRILVEVPQIKKGVLGSWALPKMPAGSDCGLYWPPPIGALVWVEFLSGDPRYPFYSGGWWTTEEGEVQVPKEMKRADVGTEDEPGDDVTARGFKMPGGMYLLFDEKEGEEVLRLLWQNKDGAKKAFLNVDKNGSLLFQSANGSSLYLNALDDETTVFGPSGDAGAASLSLTKDGLKVIGPEGQLFEMKAGALLGQAELAVQLEVNGAQLKLDTGSVFLTGKDGSHIQMDGAGKIQIMTGGGSTIVADAGGLSIQEPGGASFSVRGGKVQVGAPTGGIMLSSATGVTMPSGVLIGDASENALKAQSFLLQFDCHVHSHPLGPTGPPMIPLSALVMKLAALKTKVG